MNKANDIKDDGAIKTPERRRTVYEWATDEGLTQQSLINDLQSQLSAITADKMILEDMYRVFPPRVTPDYEKGWNDAISFAIEKFGRNAWVQEREDMLEEALKDEGTITRLNDQLSAITAERDRYKTALSAIAHSTETHLNYFDANQSKSDIAREALGGSK